MAALLIARFDGDINDLTQAYDRAHALIMSRGGATSFGELRHHCAVGNGALFMLASGNPLSKSEVAGRAMSSKRRWFRLDFRRQTAPISRFSTCMR